MVDGQLDKLEIMSFRSCTRIYLISWVLFVLSLHGFSQSSVIAEGAVLEQLASDYTFTEGPATDPEGNVYFTDQPNNKIYRWSINGEITLFMEESNRSNGLYFDNNGVLLSCADLNNQLVKIYPDKTMEIVVGDFDGKRLNGPNDLWVHSNGRIYFTDPFYKRKWWDHEEKEIQSENVYCFYPEENKVSIVAGNLVRPNGIIGTPDGKKLFVADINDKKNLFLQN